MCLCGPSNNLSLEQYLSVDITDNLDTVDEQ